MTADDLGAGSGDRGRPFPARISDLARVDFPRKGTETSEGSETTDMADWSPLRTSLRGVEERRTFSWTELDSMVGGLPRSAYVHSAFWKGTRTGWAGFTTVDVRIGRSVTFVRRGSAAAVGEPVDSHGDEMEAPRTEADVVLVGCVRGKLDHASPAKDLYTSPLFRKERRYAEASGRPWFILSAEHGLVAPDDVLEPYELRLSSTPRDYRRAWGVRVREQLEVAVGPLQGKTLEVHAGAAYTNALRPQLQKVGAHILEPLRGHMLGQRLRWHGADHSPSRAPAAVPPVDDLVGMLKDPDRSLSPAEFLALDAPEMRSPGLYSWWVDNVGAHDLTPLGWGTPCIPASSMPVLPARQGRAAAGSPPTRSGVASAGCIWEAGTTSRPSGSVSARSSPRHATRTTSMRNNSRCGCINT